MNKKVMRRIFPEEVRRIEAGKCPLCNEFIDPTAFRTDNDIKEFNISGLCQSCQDEVFGKEEE